MNKAYLLVICVLAASFTGCLSDDTSNLEEQQNTEDETIEPVGTNNNETEDYNALIGELQNLTDEIEELRLEIEDLQASEYQAPENSNFTINDYDDVYDGDGNRIWKVTPDIRYTKEGNTLIIEYLGPEPSAYGTSWDFNETELYCKDHFPYLVVYNADGVVIDSIGDVYSEYADGDYEIENLCEYNYDENTTNHYQGYNYWSRITKTFDEEPVRIGLDYMSGGPVYTFQ